mgnify:CR=1
MKRFSISLLFTILLSMALRKELTDFEKGVIYGCHLCNKSQSEIAQLTGHPKSTIDSFLRKYRSTYSHVNKERSGRPKCLGNRDQRQLVRLVKQNRRMPLAQITAEYNAGHTQASMSTVRRNLHSLGFYGRVCARKPFISEAIRMRRLRWCNARRIWTPADWQKIIWSDESRFTLFHSDGRQFAWRRSDERFHPDCVLPTVKYGGGSIMFWSYFTVNGTGPLVKCTNNMNSMEYRAILEHELLPFLPEIADMLFQHDMAPIHTSHLIKDFFETSGINVLEWMPQSPDLNPIEFLWDEVDRRVRKRQVLPRNATELELQLREEWANIPPQLLKKLVDSMPNRVRAVIRAKGNCTKY